MLKLHGMKESDLQTSNQGLEAQMTFLKVTDVKARVGTSIFQLAIHCCSPFHIYSLLKTQTAQNHGIVASKGKSDLSYLALSLS